MTVRESQSNMRMHPQSCDTFVVLPPGTALGCVVFGKNSDRPKGEVQEVVYVPAEDHPAGTKVQVLIKFCLKGMFSIRLYDPRICNYN